jgi:hypothetical protein
VSVEAVYTTHWVEQDAGVVNRVVRGMSTSVVVVVVAAATPTAVCLALRGFSGSAIVVDHLLRSWLSESASRSAEAEMRSMFGASYS